MASLKVNIDILSLIFETIIDANLAPLLTLRSVNLEWFKTAANTPKFWSKINLNRKIHFTDPDYLCLYVQNSGGIPLEIDITVPRDLPNDSVMPALGQLMKTVHRIKSLTIEGPDLEAWQIVVSGIGEGQPAPLLERLILKSDYEYDDNDVSLFKSQSRGSPFTTLSTSLTPSVNLTHLQIPAWPLPLQPPPQLSGLISLTFDTPYFSYGDIDIRGLFLLIQAAPHLQHLKFRASDDYEQSYPISSNIVFTPQLRSLDVTIPRCGLDLIRNFQTPLLTELRLDGYLYGTAQEKFTFDDWGNEISDTREDCHILTHISTISSTIRRLNLHCVFFWCSAENFNRILSGQVFPVLEELILHESGISDVPLITHANGLQSLRRLELRLCFFVSMRGLQFFVWGRTNPKFVLILDRCARIRKKDAESLSKTVHVEYN